MPRFDCLSISMRKGNPVALATNQIRKYYPSALNAYSLNSTGVNSGNSPCQYICFSTTPVSKATAPCRSFRIPKPTHTNNCHIHQCKPTQPSANEVLIHVRGIRISSSCMLTPHDSAESLDVSQSRMAEACLSVPSSWPVRDIDKRMFPSQ